MLKVYLEATSVLEPTPEAEKKEEVPTTEVRDNPRVVLAERVVRADATPSPPAVEASEKAPVNLVPRNGLAKQRQHGTAAPLQPFPIVGEPWK